MLQYLEKNNMYVTRISEVCNKFDSSFNFYSHINIKEWEKIMLEPVKKRFILETKFSLSRRQRPVSKA